MVRHPLNFSIALEKNAGLKFSKLMIGKHDIGVSFETFRSLSGIPSM